jgi:hypothetical protein
MIVVATTTRASDLVFDVSGAGKVLSELVKGHSHHSANKTRW